VQCGIGRGVNQKPMWPRVTSRRRERGSLRGAIMEGS